MTTALVFVAMFDESPLPQRSADVLGDDPVGAYQRSAGADRLRWRIADLLTHGWDLTQATGEPIELPDDLVEQALIYLASSATVKQRTWAEPGLAADQVNVANMPGS